MKKEKSTKSEIGTQNPKSARYQFNYELRNPIELIDSARVPGGSKMGIAPDPQQVAMNAGKKVKGGAIVLGRDEQVDTDNTPQIMSGAGLFGTIGDVVDGVTGLFGLGKPKQKGGRKKMTKTLTQAEKKKIAQMIKAGSLSFTGSEAPMDITADNEQLNKQRGGAKEIEDTLKEIEGGIKKLRSMMKK